MFHFGCFDHHMMKLLYMVCIILVCDSFYPLLFVLVFILTITINDLTLALTLLLFLDSYFDIQIIEDDKKRKKK